MKSLPRDGRRKLVSIQTAAKIAARARAHGKRVVTTNGAFDILHVGHVESLTKARSLGDMLIVAINSDASVRMYKKEKGRPVVPEHERALVIAALECVDCVFIFRSKDPIPWVSKIRPAIHVKGADRTMDQIVEKEEVEKYGGTIVLLKYTGHSSTAIIRKIQRIKKPDSK